MTNPQSTTTEGRTIEVVQAELEAAELARSTSQGQAKRLLGTTVKRLKAELDALRKAAADSQPKITLKVVEQLVVEQLVKAGIDPADEAAVKDAALSFGNPYFTEGRVKSYGTTWADRWLGSSTLKRIVKAVSAAK
ncbi:MAG TPA: hypothetical protein VNS09_16530 [Solirubrobacter sp.]|nr:hypothetical protein [Solirubrobacter sp.]